MGSDHLDTCVPGLLVFGVVRGSVLLARNPESAKPRREENRRAQLRSPRHLKGAVRFYVDLCT